MGSGSFLVSMLSELRPILQIGFGGAIGFFAARWYHRDLISQLRSANFALQTANQEVQGVASTLSEKVQEHQERVKGIQSKIAGSEDRSTETIASPVAELTEANERLQAELAAAREKLLAQERQQPAAGTKTTRSDQLTSFLNREPFEEEVERFLARKRPSTEQHTLLVAAIQAQAPNSQQQPASDSLIREAARAISTSLHGADAIISRYDSDEFAVLVCGGSASKGEQRARDVRLAIERLRFDQGGETLQARASVGLTHTRPQLTRAVFLERAQLASQAALKAGGNCCYLHDGENCVPLQEATATATAAASPKIATPIETHETAPKSSRATQAVVATEQLTKEEAWKEKRAHKRQKVEASYLVAPYRAGQLPTPDMFFTAQFADISPGGCAILLPAPPPYKAFVVALNKPDGLIYLSANVVNVRKHSKSGSAGEPLYAIGCKFTGRVQMKAAPKEATPRMAATR